jgi:hypothetical protein
VLHPARGIGLKTALKTLYLAISQGCCILNDFHPVRTLSDSSSPSLEGDRVSSQLWGDIIFEHLQFKMLELTLFIPACYKDEFCG